MTDTLLGELIAGMMFLVTIFVVMIGYPVAFTLAGTGLIFAWIGSMAGVFDFTLFTGLASRYFGTMINEILVAVPLFVFMGVMLERSRIAEALLTTMGQLFGAMRGGLGISVIVVGGLLAASTGIVGATVVTMGLLSLPAMMRAGYDPKLASGIICASGTLGQIIPPSTVLIFMGDMLQGANQQAQLALGNYAIEPVSVGQLFAGAMLPGLTLVGLYIVWVLLKATFQPSSCPAIVMSAEERAGLLRNVMVALVPPLILIVTVLGSILSGIATATESASVGAVGAMLMAAMRRRLDFKMLNEVMLATVKISSMVFVILLGASVFSLTFRGLGGEAMVTDILAAMPGGQFGAVLAVMLLTFVLGFFLDTFEIIFIIVPITAPALIMLGVDPIWLGVALGVNLQTSFLTPPFGFALFYLRGVASRVLSTVAIYRGVIPFIGLQIVGIVLIWLVPGMATWLPNELFSTRPTPAAVAPAAGGQGVFGDFFEQQRDEGAPDGQDGFGNLFGPPGGGEPAGDNGFGDLFGPSDGGGGGQAPQSEPSGSEPAAPADGGDDFQNLFNDQ